MIELKEVMSRNDIANPVLKTMVGYTPEHDVQFLFLLTQDGSEKGVFIAKKEPQNELQTLYFGSHYLLKSGVPLYEKTLQAKLAHLKI